MDCLPGIHVCRRPDLLDLQRQYAWSGGRQAEKLRNGCSEPCGPVTLSVETAGQRADKVEIHKIIRAVSRRTNIAYEDLNGEVYYDDTPDELPFDLDAPVVEITPQDYAIWYQDISEEPDKYKGKTLKIGGFTMVRDKLPAGSFIFGRRIMTCCVEDITFAGLLATGYDTKNLQDQQWVELTAKVAIKHNRVYNKKGPVLHVLSLTPGTAPEQDVATFY